MRVNHPPVHGSEAQSLKQTGRGQPAQETKKSAAGEVKDKKAPIESAENTEISTKSKDFVNAKAVATAAPDTREDRIAELKRQVSEGTYKLDHDAIADKMVDEHLKMPGMS